VQVRSITAGWPGYVVVAAEGLIADMVLSWIRLEDDQGFAGD
jgi:hypothetical protein